MNEDPLRLLLVGDTSEVSKLLAIGEGTLRTMGWYMLETMLKDRGESAARARLTEGGSNHSVEAFIDELPEGQLHLVLRYLLNELAARDGKPGTPSIVTEMLDRVHEHMGETGLREAAKAVAAFLPDIDVVHLAEVVNP